VNSSLHFVFRAITPFLFVLLFGARAFAADAPLPEKPNFVIIFIDDMGYGDIGPFGATKQKTPNLDRMAREGMKLTSFYAAPVCSVSRAQLLTGCYGARVSVPGVFFPAGRNGLNPKEVTIAERLKERGYATQCIGKWHLGDQPAFLPTRQGFDHYLGFPYSNDMQTAPATGTGRVVPLVRDEKVEELLTDAAQSQIVERYTNEAVGFIRAQKDAPFFLYLPHTAVHTPIHPGAAFAGKSANGRFGDWVEEVDWSVGRVLDTLRELKLEERTLVLFTSDNGPWLTKGADGGSAGPLRGGKGSTWEGGMREPTIAWWPGRIAPGSACDTVAGTIDVLPTFVKLAGGTVPAEPVIDGRDMSALLLTQSKQAPREAHFYFKGYQLEAVRQGPWKLALSPQADGMGAAAAGQGTKPRLYNLDAEIGEKTDVAAQHPEIVARLRPLAAKLAEEIGGTKPTARRPAGEVEHPTLLYAPAVAAPGAAPARAEGRPPRLDGLKPGATLRSAAAPNVAGRGFELTCVVETAQKDAVIVAHGGMAAGYALHLKGGRVGFAVRTAAGDALGEVFANAAASGKLRIRASLTADAKMSLQVNDAPAVTGKAPGLIPKQPAEEFCVGHDSLKPVTNYGGTEPFHGSITELKIAFPE
jgi:arylsulfatase A